MIHLFLMLQVPNLLGIRYFPLPLGQTFGFRVMGYGWCGRVDYVTRIPGYGRAGATPETARSSLVAAGEAYLMARKPLRDRISQCTSVINMCRRGSRWWVGNLAGSPSRGSKNIIS
jgi:hypothetical protein